MPRILELSLTTKALRLYDKLKQGPLLDERIVLRELQEHALAVELQIIVSKGFGDISVSVKYRPNPPVRDLFGLSNISLFEGAIPAIRLSYWIGGVRMEVHKRLVEEVIASGKL